MQPAGINNYYSLKENYSFSVRHQIRFPVIGAEGATAKRGRFFGTYGRFLGRNGCFLGRSGNLGDTEILHKARGASPNSLGPAIGAQ